VNIRKQEIVTNNVYHILNKSIEKFIIFNTDYDYARMIELIKYYQFANVPVKYSYLMSRSIEEQINIKSYIKDKNEKLVNIISYCLMPTHFHMTLQQFVDGGISKFVNLIQSSYSKYFNIKHDRKGPLWQGYYKNVLVSSDKQLLHLTRYHHLNPVSAGLIDKPEDWEYSSYNEYLGNIKTPICNYNELLKFKPNVYKRFMENRINYQRELTRIKKIILE
jgi:putative transposase